MRESGETAGPLRVSEPTSDHCPACERFIGDAAPCPFCGEDAYRSPALRALRLAALVLASLGLAVLYAGARWHRVPELALADLTPMMNHAAVRVSGHVRGVPFIGRADEAVDYVSIRIVEDGHELRIRAYDDAARDLVASGAMPQAGDPVAATGQLTVSARGEASMRLRRASDLQGLSSDSDTLRPAGEEAG